METKERKQKYFWTLVASFYFWIIYAFVEIRTLFAGGIASIVMLLVYFFIFKKSGELTFNQKLWITYACGVIVVLFCCQVFFNVSVIGKLLSGFIMPLFIAMSIGILDN